MTSLIHPENAWALWAVIAAGTGIAIWLEQSYQWAAKISGPVLALVMAMILSNVGIMPTAAPCYDFVGDYLVPLAIPLLLMRANLLKIARETGWMFVAFHLSALGTMLGAALATIVLREQIEQIAPLAGIMTGSYTGGSVNFFAVRESFQVSENLANPLLVADNFIMAGMFVVILFIAGSSWFRRRYPHPHTLAADGGQTKSLAAEHWRRKEISLLDIARSLAIALAVVAVAFGIHTAIRQRFETSLAAAVLGNMFVLITFLSMAVATLFHRQVEAINGPEELGCYMLYVFLFAIGLPADLWAVIRNVPLLFVFCLIMAITNLVVTLVLGKLFRIDLEELLLCVSATLGGPTTAAAMAIAKGWPKLIVPSLLVGIWGYVIGTFLGVLVGELLQALL
jgi:uncharacterized membrane protein